MQAFNIYNIINIIKPSMNALIQFISLEICSICIRLYNVYRLTWIVAFWRLAYFYKNISNNMI